MQLPYPSLAASLGSAARTHTVAVVGATGHTGRFVVTELRRRGLTPILIGRDAAALRAVSVTAENAEVRVAMLDNPASLDRALVDTAAVINCAGPFLDTAPPVIAAALRARIHYLDVTAEQAAAQAAFEQWTDAARERGIVIAPAMAFYGGLSDLLATVAMGTWTHVDEICIGIALDSWQPTLGTRLTGTRNSGPRYVFSKRRLEVLADPPPTQMWDFPEPFGRQEVMSVPLSEIITISSHLQTAQIQTYMNLAPLRDLRDPTTPAPVAIDECGRSAQQFLVEAIARVDGLERRVAAHGRDIYAITAPIVVEAAERILDGRCRVAAGVGAAGALFAAEEFLRALVPEHLALELSQASEIIGRSLGDNLK